MPGLKIANSGFCLATSKNFSRVPFSISVSGLSIRANLVLTSFSPILLPFPYPRLSPDKIHLTFLNSLSMFDLCYVAED